jgi:hypothetical protein
VHSGDGQIQDGVFGRWRAEGEAEFGHPGGDGVKGCGFGIVFQA